MNFLAHCALARDYADRNPSIEMNGLLAGAVIGDFTKGPVKQEWPPSLAQGIRLHRKVDALSNQNPHMQALSGRFPDPLRRFAPIFLDLLLDHALARSWHRFHDDSAEEFAVQCYLAIDEYQRYLPDHGVRFFHYMQEQNLLASYTHWPHVMDGVHSVMRRLNRRRVVDLSLQEIEQAMHATLPVAEQSLVEFYPDFRQQIATSEL